MMSLGEGPFAPLPGGWVGCSSPFSSSRSSCSRTSTGGQERGRGWHTPDRTSYNLDVPGRSSCRSRLSRELLSRAGPKGLL
jgi:hypothetical protein